MSNLEQGSKTAQKNVEHTMVNLFNEHRPECTEKQRGLDPASNTTDSECDQTYRGIQPKRIENDRFFSNHGSLQLQTAPGDDLLIQTFRFQHLQ